ncbi:MAG: DUF2325 domain-containing protein [Limosilactobacillus coleohominis]|nr:DUF2325 domain-containing protein [Limosilactobacillus coleohominis]MDY3703196.1 DUF2325 domain-containing protein [Limosilactobacillus coleohominis]
MYDYRKDLLSIINNIDASEDGLLRGREILNAAINLVNALPSDNKSTSHPFIIKQHEHHRPSENHPTKALTKQSVHPLNGTQYEILNKLKGIRRSLDNLNQGQKNNNDSPEKLAKRYHKIAAHLSEQDQTALAEQLKSIHHDLKKLGLSDEKQLSKDQHLHNHNEPTDDSTTPVMQEYSSSNSHQLIQKFEKRQPKVPFSSQKGQYVVQRELSGATLLTENGQDAGHISEGIVRKMNLTSGTIVKADIMSKWIFVHKVLRHIDRMGDIIFDDKKKIGTFEFGVVKKHKHHLRVTYNSNNEPLLINGKKYPFLLDLNNPVVGNGSIVELAWYKDDPSSMRIRWTYPTEDSNNQKQIVSKSPSKVANEDQDENRTLTKRYPDLDLNHKTVAVLVGNRQEHEDYQRQIELYNGQPTIVDSFKTKKSFLKDKLKSADIVILVKSKAHHGASKAVAEFQNQFGFAFAVANTLSMGQFEYALYRASNGLPADITSMDNLH